MRRSLIMLALAAGCFQGPDRAPVVLGAKRGDGVLAERVARKIESAGCRVDRRFDLATSIDADRLMDAGEIDGYLESERTALIDVLKLPVSQAVSIEQTVRPVYVNRGMLWSPPLGRGDLAVVFRKDIDRKCREATRALMRVAYIADAK